MTTYNELAGLRVQYVSTDPTLNTGNEGQVWYNSTTGTLRALVQLKAWSAAANLPVAKNAAASDGTSTAGWTAGGSNTPAANTGTTATEEYSGFTWSSGGNLNTARTFLDGSGFGTQTAAAVAGGATQPAGGPTRTTLTATEEYNGTSWTSVTGLPTSTFAAAQCGIQTSGLSFGGTSGYGNPSFNTALEYDGTNWTSGGNLNTAANYQAAGIQTAALGVRSNSSSDRNTEAYNGSTWTAVANINTARNQIVGFGIQSLATIAGGFTAGPGSPQFTETEQWDGTAWGISTATLGTATRTGMGIGTVGGGTSGLLAGGFQTNYLADTQEFNSTIFSPATGAWASGGNLPGGRNGNVGAGTQTAGLSSFGNTGPAYTGTSFEYDGSTWTAGGTGGTARGYLGGCGTQTSALAFGGVTTTALADTEEYDGSTWSPGGNLNTARYFNRGAGTQTAAVTCGGTTTPTTSLTATEKYDGTSWTTSGNMNTSRWGVGTAGEQTSTLAFGGFTPSTTASGAVESFNGSTWTTNPVSLNNARGLPGGVGLQTLALAFGGASPPADTGATELWDGTGWTSAPPMATARGSFASAGTQTAALGAGGYRSGQPIPGNIQTEEWSGPQTTATASTLTTS